jgi:transcriptional regulator with XRE-family HTH domain
MKAVGLFIKHLREEKDMSVRELASRAGISASFLSQVEHGKVSPSLASLKRLADELGTTIGALVGEPLHNPASSPVVRADQRKVYRGEGPGIDMFMLTSSDPNKQMEPLLFRLSPDSTTGKEAYKHFGQEFVLVIKGMIEITLNDTRYVLKKGDSMYFNSSVPHSFRNINKGESEAVWVVTPPSF